MDTTDSPDRWREIRDIWKNNQWLYMFTGFLLGIMFFPALQIMSSNFNELLQSLVPEAFGIVFTVLFVDRLYEQRRVEAREEQKLKAQLVRDAGSQSNEAALRAITELHQRGWLEGKEGLLKSADLSGAKLQRADLMFANLQGSDLRHANLEQAYLGHSNLQNANLFNSNLQNTNLSEANLQYVDLSISHLQGANFTGANLKGALINSCNLQSANFLAANLQGADLSSSELPYTDFWGANLYATNLSSANLQASSLRHANLQHANLKDTIFDKNTLLPDESHWTPETDLTRFTDPNHPNFWRSDEEWSPAYRGEDETTSKD